MTKAQDSGNLEHAQVHNPHVARAGGHGAAGRPALTLVPVVGALLKQTLLALREGVQLAEHHVLGRQRCSSCRAGCGR
jgi:hypothetical protein